LLFDVRGATLLSTMDSPPRPTILGRYMISDEIGAGGMATVHLGRALGAAGFSRVVAIKRLQPHFIDSEKLTTMLIDEARIASRIRHPNVVAMTDVERIGDHELLLVMEYVHGPSLAWLQSNLRLQQSVMPLRIALRIIVDVLDGLHAAHVAKSERGRPLEIVHRDISPQNILVGQDGIARVTDFGIAKAEGRISFTHDGEIKGKLSYMSREQLRGDPSIDLRSDIFSTGVVLWEMLTGQRLFALDSSSASAKAARAAAATSTMTALPPGSVTATMTLSALAAAEAAAAAWNAATDQAKSPIELLLAMKAETPPSALTPNIPPELDAAVMKALSIHATDRFENAEAMSAAISRANAPIATTKEVSEWTRQIASAFLLQRQEMIDRIEQVSAIILEPSTSTQPMPTSPMDHTLPIPRASAPTVDMPAAVVPIVAKKKSKLPLVLLAGALLAAVAVVIAIVIVRQPATGAIPSAVPGIESEAPTVPSAKRRPNRKRKTGDVPVE